MEFETPKEKFKSDFEDSIPESFKGWGDLTDDQKKYIAEIFKYDMSCFSLDMRINISQQESV